MQKEDMYIVLLALLSTLLSTYVKYIIYISQTQLLNELSYVLIQSACDVNICTC